MDTKTSFDTDLTLLDQVLSPARTILMDYTRCTRSCPMISDEDFLPLGFLRTLSQAQSGRDSLQHQAEVFEEMVSRTSFFDSLHSTRRKSLLAEMNRQLYSRSHLQDPEDLLAAFPELADRAVWAVDGHKIEHACHALRDTKGRHVAPNTLYLLCLHTSLLFNLAAVQGDGAYAHEMPVFRASWRVFFHRQLKTSTPDSAPVLVVDPAYVDNAFWDQQRLLRQTGVLMITRAKGNIAPRQRRALSFDAADPMNLGVESDERVTFDGGHVMRLIHYIDPETGTSYHFLTTEMTLRPGVVAWLYLLRWRIEKVFDTSKNKLQETKAWATGQTARCIQAHFLALTHNLLVLFRGLLAREYDLEDEKIRDRREQHLDQRQVKARAEGRQVNPLHFLMPTIIQLSVQLIRTLRNHIFAHRSFREALPRIRAMLLAYL